METSFRRPNSFDKCMLTRRPLSMHRNTAETQDAESFLRKEANRWHFPDAWFGLWTLWSWILPAFGESQKGRTRNLLAGSSPSPGLSEPLVLRFIFMDHDTKRRHQMICSWYQHRVLGSLAFLAVVVFSCWALF